jgi:hypothetical protein
MEYLDFPSTVSHQLINQTQKCEAKGLALRQQSFRMGQERWF